jgi:hypothetical protein
MSSTEATVPPCGDRRDVDGPIPLHYRALAWTHARLDGCFQFTRFVTSGSTRDPLERAAQEQRVLRGPIRQRGIGRPLRPWPSYRVRQPQVRYRLPSSSRQERTQPIPAPDSRVHGLALRRGPRLPAVRFPGWPGTAVGMSHTIGGGMPPGGNFPRLPPTACRFGNPSRLTFCVRPRPPPGTDRPRRARSLCRVG